MYRPCLESISEAPVATPVPTGGTASMILMNGTLVLGANNSPSGGPFGTGALFVNGGVNTATLTANNGATGWTLANPVLINSNVTLGDASNDALTLSGAATFIGNAATVTLTTPGNGVTMSGNIGESGAVMALIKAGPGTLVLSGSNNYTGGTAVDNGTLEAMTPASLPNYATDYQVFVQNAGQRSPCPPPIGPPATSTTSNTTRGSGAATWASTFPPERLPITPQSATTAAVGASSNWAPAR